MTHDHMYSSFHFFRVLQKARDVVKIPGLRIGLSKFEALKAGALGGSRNLAASGLRGDASKSPEMNPKPEP